MAITTKTPALDTLDRIGQLADELLTETIVFSYPFRTALQDVAYQAG